MMIYSFLRFSLFFAIASYCLVLLLVITTIIINYAINNNINEYVSSSLAIAIAVIFSIAINHYTKKENHIIKKIIGFRESIGKTKYNENIELFFKPEMMNIKAYILWLILTMAVPYYAIILSFSNLELEKNWAQSGLLAVIFNSVMSFRIWVQAAKE